MTALAAWTPVIALLMMASIHLAYFRRNARRDSQQFIALADLSFRTARGSARFGSTDWTRAHGQRLAGVYDVMGAGRDLAGADPTLFEPITGRVADALGTTLVLEGDTTLAAGRYIDTLVCTGDLLIADDCVFLSSVKVDGDLVVTGKAAFLKPLVVAGHTHIQGVTAISAGMVAKGELVVDGTLLVGDRNREGWVATGDCHVGGQIYLNGHIDSLTPEGGPLNGKAQGYGALIAMALAVIAYVIANPLAALAMGGTVGVFCASDVLTLNCDYPRHAADLEPAYAALAIIAAAFLLAGRAWFRGALAYPFVMTMAGLTVGTLLYDVTVSRPIIEEARIINDTMTVLGAAMLASFILSFAIMRRGRLSLGHAAIAIVVSFGAKIAAMVGFAIFRETIMGATELLMLFVVYTFGAFTVHLMALCGMLRHLDLSDERQAVIAPAKKSDRRTGTVDGLRGIAILLVVIYHYVPPEFFSFSLGKPINSILFVVAGFFFAALLLKNRKALDAGFAERIATLRGLLISRHLRIWPALALIVGFYLVLSLIDHGALTQQIRSTWPYYLTYLGYVPRWAYEQQAFPSHLWVVSAQETLILAFCAAFALFGLKAVRKSLWVLVAIGIASRMIGTATLMPLHTSMALETPLAVLDPLVLGMIVRFGLERTGIRSQLRRRLILSLIVTLAIWVVLPNWNMTYFGFAPLLSALATALAMTLSADEIRGRRIAAAGLSSPWLVFLGRISFGLFLLHPLVNTILRLSYTAITGVEMPWWALLAIGPALSIGAATLFARYFELPMRRFAGRQRAPRATLAVGTAPSLAGFAKTLHQSAKPAAASAVVAATAERRQAA